MKWIHESVPFEDVYEGFRLTQFIRDSRETVEEVKALFDEVINASIKVRKLTMLTNPGEFVVLCIISWVEFSDSLCDTGSAI